MAFGGFDSRGGSPQPMADINTTPLVDVMLVLLVIFIITAPLLTHAIRLELPNAPAPVSADPPQVITLSIDSEGRIFWNNEPVPDEPALAQRMQEAAARTPPPPLQLRADRQARYQSIAQVMAMAQQAGLTRIGFVTDPSAASMPAPVSPAAGSQTAPPAAAPAPSLPAQNGR
jgi:biopolymer transport protein ExbD